MVSNGIDNSTDPQLTNNNRKERIIMTYTFNKERYIELYTLFSTIRADKLVGYDIEPYIIPHGYYVDWDADRKSVV